MSSRYIRMTLFHLNFKLEVFLIRLVLGYAQVLRIGTFKKSSIIFWLEHLFGACYFYSTSAKIGTIHSHCLTRASTILSTWGEACSRKNISWMNLGTWVLLLALSSYSELNFLFVKAAVRSGVVQGPFQLFLKHVSATEGSLALWGKSICFRRSRFCF